MQRKKRKTINKAQYCFGLRLVSMIQSDQNVSQKWNKSKKNSPDNLENWRQTYTTKLSMVSNKKQSILIHEREKWRVLLI